MLVAREWPRTCVLLNAFFLNINKYIVAVKGAHVPYLVLRLSLIYITSGK